MLKNLRRISGTLIPHARLSPRSLLDIAREGHSSAEMQRGQNENDMFERDPRA